MIQVENIETMNFAAAIRGMRNPMNRWAAVIIVFTEGIPGVMIGRFVRSLLPLAPLIWA